MLQTIYTKPHWGRYRHKRDFVDRDALFTAAEDPHLIDQQKVETLLHHQGFLGLEIGYGMGEHLLFQGANHPHHTWIGCDPFKGGAYHLLPELAANTYNQIRLFIGDARVLIDTLRPCNKPVFNQIHILFPDPWPKKRHHKRRIIQTNFLDNLKQLIKPDGHLLIATDHEDYQRHISACLTTAFAYRWTCFPRNATNIPWPPTKYELKAQQEGRTPLFYLVNL